MNITFFRLKRRFFQKDSKKQRFSNHKDKREKGEERVRKQMKKIKKHPDIQGVFLLKLDQLKSFW